MKTIKDLAGFEWDKGNIDKNKKHDVENKEAEEVFLDDKKIAFKDSLHSKLEERSIIIGKTKKSRLLYVAYTKRDKKIRIISARSVNKKEVYIYEEKIKTAKI
jgi:uncharacterized DUF497 family protein